MSVDGAPCEIRSVRVWRISQGGVGICHVPGRPCIYMGRLVYVWRIYLTDIPPQVGDCYFLAALAACVGGEEDYLLRDLLVEVREHLSAPGSQISIQELNSVPATIPGLCWCTSPQLSPIPPCQR